MLDLKKVIRLTIIILITSCTNSNNDSFVKTIYTNNPFANTTYIGKIVFKSDLDSIKLTNKDLKSTVLFLGKFKKRHSVKELEKMHHTLDTFGFIEKNNDTIYFDYRFKNKGKYFLDGYIEEEVFLENYYKDGRSRLITNQIKFSKEIKVIKK